MSKDLTDLAGEGLDLSTLPALATSTAIHDKAQRVALARRGVALLTSILERVQDPMKEDASPAQEVGALLQSRERLAIMALAHLEDRGKVAGLLLQLRGERGGAQAAGVLKEEIERVASAWEAPEPRERRTPARELPAMARSLEMPDAERWTCPQGWTLEGGRIYRIKPVKGGEEQLRITHSPILLTGLYRDVDTDDVCAEVAWRLPSGRWHREIVEKSRIAKARDIVDLANRGAPITSVNAAGVVSWLADLEAEVMPSLPKAHSVARMGWVRGGFVVGESYLASGGGHVQVSLPAGKARGWGVKGDFSAWTRGVQEYVTDRPLAVVGIYAALASPLLEVLQRPGFVVSWDGETSRGKTTTLWLAASVWGDPTSEEVVGTWETTRVGVEQNATTKRNLPLFLDETQSAPYPTLVANALYQIPNGVTKARGTTGRHTRAMASWRLLMLCTGEKPITSFREDGGGAARALSIHGAPWGDAPAGSPQEARNGRAAVAIKDLVRDHHGHLGAALIRWLLADPDHQAHVREMHARHARAESDAVSGSVAKRLSGYVAVLATAAEIAHDVLGLPLLADWGAIQAALYSAADRGARNADKALVGWQRLADWLAAEEARVKAETSKRTAPGGWIGAHVGMGDDQRIGLIPSALREMLTRQGLAYDACVARWADRGWIEYQEVDSDGRTGRRYAIQKRTALGRRRLILAKVKALDEHG